MSTESWLRSSVLKAQWGVLWTGKILESYAQVLAQEPPQLSS